MLPQVLALSKNQWMYVLFALVAAVMVGGWYLWLFLRERAIARQLKEGPESLYQDVEGARIHYLRTGRGPHLVLLHGIGASVYTWRLLIPLLAPHFTVTAVDIPGFGRSSKRPERDHGLDEQSRILSKFLSQIGVEEAGLVGSSMGGAIVLWMARGEPDRFRAVAALAPAVSPRLMPMEMAKLSKLIPGTAQFFLNSLVIKNILKRVVSRRELLTDTMVHNYQRPFLEDGKAIQTFLKATAVLRDERLPDQLREMEPRVMILYGAEDKLVPKSVMDELRQILPSAIYAEHDSAGHHPMEDEPQWTASRIRDFFK